MRSDPCYTFSMSARLALKLILCGATAAAFLVPTSLSACSYGSRPWTEAEIDSHYRQNLSRLTELFEAEVLKIDGENSEMRVLRVFRGSLRPGQFLRGRPLYDSCRTSLQRVGDRGVIWISFGPRGPVFPGDFISETTAQSLRRMGALPDE